MNKKRRLLCIAIIIAIVMCFGGCAHCSESNAMREYSFSSTIVKYSEANSQYSFSKEAYFTETQYARYYFETTISESQRQSCIEATDKIIAELEAVNEKTGIYIFSKESFNGVNVSDNALWTYETDWKSADYVANVITAAYGEGCHYGLAFGYAVMLCEKFAWESSYKYIDSIPDDPEIFDLNLLCFDKNFVSEKDLKIVRQTAGEFVDYLKELYGADNVVRLLSNSNTYDGMIELNRELEKYYAVREIEYSPSMLRFSYGGVSYDYVLQSEFADFYIGTEWTDLNCDVNPLVSENFLHENYSEVKEFFERNLDQMLSYRELFALGSYDNELAVIFPNAGKASQYSYYQSASHQIIVYNVDSLMHEYIHALTKPATAQKLWETEGFARYFSYYYDYYATAFLNEDYNTAVESEKTEYLFEFKQTVDRPIDIQIDFKELENIAVYSRGYTDPNESYAAGSSFVQYLVREYGETFVAQCIYGDGSDFPKSYSELVDGWNRYIEENYSAFSRYIK